MTGSASRWHGGDAELHQRDTHATRLVDAYYTPDAPVPPLRQFRLIDKQGSDAPFG